jgi:hypothetical protein
MVTLTKLFVTNIVASSRSESLNNTPIFSSDGCFLSFISLRSEGLSEKNAISEAEAKPDANNSSPAIDIANMAESDGVVMFISLNMSVKPHKKLSESKVLRFS